MTLIVSQRTSDGVVIAGDSFATAMMEIHAQAHTSVKCPSCAKEIQVHPNITVPSLPISTFPFSQKIFPLFSKKFGVGSAGLSQVAGKTIYFAARQLEKQITAPPNSVQEAAEVIYNHFYGLLLQQFPNMIAEAPEDWKPITFQVCGYTEDKPISIVINIGKNKDYDKGAVVNIDLGCTFCGDGQVVMQLWGLYKSNPISNPRFQNFSLQDAIDYAEFLINTTSQFQRFSAKMPTVGGFIDVGLITPFDGFKWIKQKPLYEKIGGSYV